MKTLYDILGLAPSATAEQIEHAYASQRARLDRNESGIPPSELHNHSVAIKEAYALLTDPVSRQHYDQKLALARKGNAPARPVAVEVSDAPSGRFFSTKALIIIGIFLLAGIYLYNEKAKERERLRIEHEHELQMKAVQIEEERQRHTAQLQDTIVDKVSESAAAAERLAQQRQFEADSLQRQRLELQRQQMDNQQQRQAQLQREREEATRQRQEQMLAQQRAQAEKRYLQQLERERYGKVITY